jgi:hypothetical protein
MQNTIRVTRRWGVAGMIAVLVLMLMPCAEGLAQKKKTVTKSESTSSEQQVAPSPGTKAGATMKEFLSKFKGSRTSLGVLSRIESDHFFVDDDGAVALYPFAAIRSIKILKPEEGEENPVLLDISLL